MENLFNDLSKRLYDTYFFKNFKEKDWKIGYVLKKMDGETQEVIYIGARFDELYWQEKDKIRKNHFFVQILKTTNLEGEKYTISYHERNTRVDDEQITKEIVNFFKEKGYDELLYIDGYGYEREKYATGENSEKVVKLMKAVRHSYGISDYDDVSDEFQFRFTTSLYKVVPNIKDKEISIFVGSKEIKRFGDVDSVIKFMTSLASEDKEIITIMDQAIKTIKERAKITDVANYGYNYLRIESRTYADMSLKKMYNSGKAKYSVVFDKSKVQVKTLDEAREKMEEFAVKFANNYRIRRIVGNK